jgi:hypothetical protein
MLEEPLQNGLLPLFIQLLLTPENDFLHSSRSSYKIFSFPPLVIDMCENGDETEGGWKKTK